MIRIDAITEMRLTPAQDRAIGALLDVAFVDAGFGGRSFHKQHHHLRIVAQDGAGGIVGHIALLLRVIRVGDRLTPIVGVAEVATHPDNRGQGIAGAMLTRAIVDARSSLAEFMVLFGHRPIYAGHGFRRAANPLTYLQLDGARSGGVVQRRDDTLMILPLGDVVWPDDAPVDLVGHIF
ncbi:Predicted N-acetyltransferase YhbS [Loktanella fryxellensis]|uniref:Predicted N-acetyltransferase YhbS n=1 Tax=Loktanella fryxellensis TaxID=245187 RepID=A0A1H7ZUT2_9RHOB|nr:GNAT family N-acetyltransferase [Loktanella fryxellensis]SEM61239.1 Predicted N-acetyltransferase YhbS [Loktanella fryxellensis]